MSERDPFHGEYFETVIERPPEGWTLGYVTLTLKIPPERKPIEAWRRGAFAVHQVASPTKGARLTHAPTGLQIWTFETSDKAAEAAERIESLTDWQAIKEGLPLGTELYPKVRAVIDEISSDEKGAVL